MITIVNYDTEASHPIAKMLAELGIAYKVSNNEKDIISSDKLILPDGKDIRVIFRKLQLLNMYSLLKMVKKPILGIGSGMFLMCEKLGMENVCGLGMLPVDGSVDKIDPIERKKTMKFLKNTFLFEGIDERQPFFFHNDYNLPLSDYTTATIDRNGEVFTASLTKENCNGILFAPELSGENGNQILRNFAAL